MFSFDQPDNPQTAECRITVEQAKGLPELLLHITLNI